MIGFNVSHYAQQCTIVAADGTYVRVAAGN
jgi:hypothetical protein